MGSPAIDPEDIVRHITTTYRRLDWTPLDPDVARLASEDPEHDRGPIEFLHANWAPADTFDPGVAGRGLRARAVAAFGRLTFRVLGPYFRHQREVVSRQVQAIAELERRCDSLVRRQDQLEQAAIARQVAEARNLVDLAVVLDTGTARSADAATGRPGGPGSPEASR